jgi:hypothetical protein
MPMGQMVLKFQVKEQFAIYFLQPHGDKRTNKIFVTPLIKLRGAKNHKGFTYSTHHKKKSSKTWKGRGLILFGFIWCILDVYFYTVLTISLF